MARPTGQVRDQLLAALAQPDVPPGPTQTGAASCPPREIPTIEVAIRTGATIVVRDVIVPVMQFPCAFAVTAVYRALERIPDSPATLIPTNRLLSEGAVQAGCQQNLALPFGGQYDHTVAGATPAPSAATVGVCLFSNPDGKLVRYGRAPTARLTQILSTGISPPQQYCPASLEISVGPIPAATANGVDPTNAIVVEQTGCHRILARGRVIGHLSDAQVSRLESLATDPESD